MLFQFTPEQIAAISALAGVSPPAPDTDGTRRALYNTIFEAITDGYGTSSETPKADVDQSVWLWVRGARDVNSGTGYFADFIRE